MILTVINNYFKKNYKITCNFIHINIKSCPCIIKVYKINKFCYIKIQYVVWRICLSWSKKSVVAYHFISSANDDYFTELKLSFNSLLNSEDSSGTFDAGQSHYYWKIESKVDIADTNTFLVSFTYHLTLIFHIVQMKILVEKKLRIKLNMKL